MKKNNNLRMGKKIFLFFSILLFCASVQGAITEYTVPSNLPLNRFLTIYGLTDTSNQLCSFFIFDTADQNQAIIRLSDEYSNESGRFYSEYQVTEPLFKRGYDYNAVTVCGSNVAHQLFYIEQKDDLVFGVTPAAIMSDFEWWTDPDNSQTVAFTFFIVIFVALIAYGIAANLAT